MCIRDSNLIMPSSRAALSACARVNSVMPASRAAAGWRERQSTIAMTASAAQAMRMATRTIIGMLSVMGRFYAIRPGASGGSL